MAAGIVEPTGKAAGRVTITTTLMSLIPPFATVLVVVVIFLLGIISAEVAAALILGILVNAGLTSGAVFTTAKNTPTDQKTVVWGSAPVADVVTPPATFDTEATTDWDEIPVVAEEPTAKPEAVYVPAEMPAAPAPSPVSLTDEVKAARATGSTAV